MLTRKFILKVTRLLDQTGEPRPGFLHDGSSNLGGQGTSPELHTVKKARKEKSGGGRCVTVRLSYETDSVTDEPRLVQK